MLDPMQHTPASDGPLAPARRGVIEPGLVSVTLRALTPREIVTLCVETDLRAIEWGGDIHCPPGDAVRAREVAALTRDAGLGVAAYGSYYRAGAPGQPEFAAVLETARLLGAPWIRVWAGPDGSAAISPTQREGVVADLRRITALAAAARIGVTLEFHAKTLTDTLASTLELLRAVPDASVHWQPPHRQPHVQATAELRELLPRLSNVHVFAWSDRDDTVERLALAAHRERWREYLHAAVTLPGLRHALLEFVRADDPAALREDARTLRELLAELVPET